MPTQARPPEVRLPTRGWAPEMRLPIHGRLRIPRLTIQRPRIPRLPAPRRPGGAPGAAPQRPPADSDSAVPPRPPVCRSDRSAAVWSALLTIPWSRAVAGSARSRRAPLVSRSDRTAIAVDSPRGGEILLRPRGPADRRK
jgi:hypothetical protein